jgi:hypothetical protein
MIRQVERSCLSTTVVIGGGGGLVRLVSEHSPFFRLEAPPHQPRVGGGHIRYGVYGSLVVYRWRKPTVSRF